jgi:lipid A 3-O-deacylase
MAEGSLTHGTCVACAILLQLAAAFAHGQAMDPTAGFRAIDAEASLRLHFENDVLAGADQYYSNGLGLELVHPAFRGFFLTAILARGGGIRQAGMTVEQEGYTPTSIESATILWGDRPFAATLMLSLFAVSGRSGLPERITSSLWLGVLGPVAGGFEMQSTIHRLIGDVQPLGWQNQVRNDAIVDYDVGYERNVAAWSDWFLLNALGKARVGTLRTRLSLGLDLMIGWIDAGVLSEFSLPAVAAERGFRLHLFWQPAINIVGYDATLQGGMFNRTSPYTIPADEVARVTFQSNQGIVVGAGRFFCEYSYTFLTREYATGSSHWWGGVHLGWEWRHGGAKHED